MKFITNIPADRFNAFAAKHQKIIFFKVMNGAFLNQSHPSGLSILLVLKTNQVT